VSKETDKVTGTETTGHEWDGIKELNTPLPRWWLWTFYGTIVFALGYTIAYPAWPMISSATTGLLGYSSRADVDVMLAEAGAAQASYVARIEAMDVSEILLDEKLERFARAGGKSAFKIYCSQCHGTGAEGAPGYPNLNDDEWIWGGTIEEIYASISHGIRSPADPDTHYNIMPNFGTEDLLPLEQIRSVARQVASFSGIDGGADSPEGATVYQDNCAACHGGSGEGVTELGGPSLMDPIWLYGGTLEDIEAQIAGPKHGVMPAWSARLGDTWVKQLAVYVHGLGGGQ
jgi:cytochrome c oxidase cbb3-type subunit III